MKTIKFILYKFRRELLISAVLSGIVLYIISHFIFYFAIIPSESMVSTLYVGDKVFVSKNIYPLQKGEIYTFYHDKTLLIKRLIGTGGDHIKIEGDTVYINGEKLDEPYVSSTMLTDINMEFTVPEGKCFFLGDNRRFSNDARFWADPYIDESEIDGKALKIISPKKHRADL